MTRRLLVACAALATMALTLPSSALADEKQACLAASERAQQLRNAGKLIESREQFAICGRAECPRLIQQDCAQWMSELLTQQPSVIPAARDKSGRDLSVVHVLIDQRIVAEMLDGKPIPVDPGPHTLRFEMVGSAPVDERIVVRQGEKNRIVSVTLAPADAGATGAPANGAPDTNSANARNTGAVTPWSFPVGGTIVGGIGLVTLGVALAVDLSANAEASRLRETCAPNCDPAEVSSVDSQYTTAAVTAVAGGVVLVTGVVWFFLHNSGRRASASSGPASMPVFSRFSPSRGGAAATFQF